MVHVIKLENSPIHSNCYILFASGSHDCIVIDPGSNDNSRLEECMKENGLTPKWIILTHEHFDHCMGVNDLLYKYPETTLLANQSCIDRIKDIKSNCSVFFDNERPFIIDWEHSVVLKDSEDYRCAGIKIHCLETPGHSEGSICLIVDDMVFTGDTVIPNMGTITRLPTGSNQLISFSIAKLCALQKSIRTGHPGHGPKFNFSDYDLNLCLTASTLYKRK